VEQRHGPGLIDIVGAGHQGAASEIKSSAAPSGPTARPCASRDRARRITSGSAPCWTASENAIAASRAFAVLSYFVHDGGVWRTTANGAPGGRGGIGPNAAFSIT
jgi:hypothetical protein